jgi:hypothetical protein
MLAEVAKTLVVRKLLENQAFPLTERAFPNALVPTPKDAYSMI